jgi:hypothetical protein
MGQYKVPQDVEAEDKILGPLTMKQFIYAVIGTVWGFLTFTVFRQAPVLFILIGLPPTFLFLMLGLYQRQGQPFEALFLALVSFFAKPRRRLWQKEPIEQVFKIEPPKKKVEEVQRDPREVRGQLEKLAQIVDTRGWAAKEPAIQEPQMTTVLNLEERIAPPDLSAPAAISTAPEVTVQDDMLDMQNNPKAHDLNVLIENTVKNIRQEALEKMKHVSHKEPKKVSKSGMTATPDPAILRLATENDDLTVSQIAAQAKKAAPIVEGQSVKLRDANASSQ